MAAAKDATHGPGAPGVTSDQAMQHDEPANGTIAAFIGLLAGKTSKVASLDEINEAAADGWSG
jgi:hypothetical protein